jgi:hypothetical protein
MNAMNRFIVPGTYSLPKSGLIAVAQLALVLCGWTIKIPAPFVDGCQLWIAAGTFLIPWYFLQSRSEKPLFSYIWTVSFVLIFLHLIIAAITTFGGIDVRSVLIVAVATLFVSFIATIFMKNENVLLLLLSAMRLALVLVTITVILDLCGGDFFGGSFHQYVHYFLPIFRPVGMLGEPSFVGVFLAPFLFLMIVCTHYWKMYFGKFFTFCVFLIAMLCPSATLVVVLTGALLIRTFGALKSLNIGHMLKRFITPLLVIVALMGIWQQTFYKIISPVTERFTSLLYISSSDAQMLNGSSMILGVAIFVTRDAVTQHPFGFGMDRYIYANHRYGYQYTANPFFVENNARDGTSILLKFITEFGAVGISTAIYFFWALFRKYRVSAYADERLVILICSYILFAVSVRGVGYFSGGMVLAIGILVGLWKRPLLVRRDLVTGKL